MARRGLVKGIPQIIDIVSISQDGKLNLKKNVMAHLGVKKAERLFLDIQNEILLSATEGTGEEISVSAGNKLRLPEEVLDRLEMDGDSLVGLVQRENAVAVKKVEVVEEDGERATVLDLETTYKITRKAITNPIKTTDFCTTSTDSVSALIHLLAIKGDRISTNAPMQNANPQ